MSGDHWYMQWYSPGSLTKRGEVGDFSDAFHTDSDYAYAGVQLVRYTREDKNAITLQQNIGGNVTAPYVYLKGVKMVKEGADDSENIAVFSDDAAVSHTFRLTNELVDKYHDYINIEENNVSEEWKNQTGSFGRRG